MSYLIPSGISVTPASRITTVTPTLVQTDASGTQTLIETYLLPLLSGLNEPVPSGAAFAGLMFNVNANNGRSNARIAWTPLG